MGNENRFDLAIEKMKMRQQVKEERTDLRNHTIPYPDVHEFRVQHYSDMTNGLIKLLRNSEYLIDEIYWKIPTTFSFFTRPQIYRNDEGTWEISSLSDDWFLQEKTRCGKNALLRNVPRGQQYVGHEFSAWMTDVNCSSEIDFGNAVGPLSTYACYVPKTYSIHFTDYYGNDVSSVLKITEISDMLAVSAFSDDTGISAYSKQIAQKVQESNSAYTELSNYYIYGFDNGYPNSLSNVRQDMYFGGIYTRIDHPVYKVHNYCGPYDEQGHSISIEFQDSLGRYRVEYSKDGTDGTYSTENISLSDTSNAEVSVYFKLSAFSEVLSEYKECGTVDHGTIRIYKRHLLEEKDLRPVLTENNLSILI